MLTGSVAGDADKLSRSTYATAAMPAEVKERRNRDREVEAVEDQEVAQKADEHDLNDGAHHRLL